MKNQDTFKSAVWGELTFFPIADNDNKKCVRCLLHCDRCMEECCLAPCIPEMRKDKKQGYFSIHQPPDLTPKELFLPFKREP